MKIGIFTPTAMHKWLFLSLTICACICAPMRMNADGWTPTDAGLVVNFESGDRFLLSVMIDDTEYFVCDYPSYSGKSGKFDYKQFNKSLNYLKLIPQDADATEPSEASIWTIGEPLTRTKNKISYPLGGIAYTMWGNSHNTLVTNNGNAFKFLGDLTANEKDNNLCDVVFVVPTSDPSTTSMDPNRTLNTAYGREQNAKPIPIPPW